MTATAPTPPGISVVQIVQLAGVGVMSFLAADFFERRDNQTLNMESSLQSDIGELKDLMRTFQERVESAGQGRDRRLFAVEAATNTLAREMDLSAQRIERLTEIMRERTLDRLPPE